MLVALAGGVGAARFLRGLVRVVPPEAVTVVVNTASLTSRQPPASGHPLTFAKDVAPIFQEKCQTCHHAGTSAPMSLKLAAG